MRSPKAPKGRLIPAWSISLIHKLMLLPMIRQNQQGGRVPEGRETVAGGGSSAARGNPGTCRQTTVRPGGAREGAAAPATASAKKASPAPPGRRAGLGTEFRRLRSFLAPPPANFSGPCGAAPAPPAKPGATRPGPGAPGRNPRLCPGKTESRVKGQGPGLSIVTSARPGQVWVNRPGLQPSPTMGDHSPGQCPGLVWAGPLALVEMEWCDLYQSDAPD